MKLKTICFAIAFLGMSFSCKEKNTEVFPKERMEVTTETKDQPVSVDELIANLEDSRNDEVIVVAHRGDWRNAPENSLQAIQNCIAMGVDMVEIDVRKTKDDVLVLMHDETIDRTTTGTGKVSELTWDYLQTLSLKDGIGHKTANKIPTLEEALALTKDRILVNLDKSYSIFDKCYAIAKKTGTVNQIIIKGFKTKEEVQGEFGDYLDKVYFMPIVRLNEPDANVIIDEYLEGDIPVAFEFLVPQDTIKCIERFKELREKGASVWVNSLWPEHNAGHDDERAALDPKVYQWYIDQHINIIQTDRPKILLDYLRRNNLHD